MVESPDERPASESTLDRATRIRNYLEALIAEVGEHPECELKVEWRRDTGYHKAEFIKDIQATANSAILPQTEKYIVVGASESSRTVTGCSHADFDEANVRQLLESYLDPVPEFEVFKLRSSKGVDFVVFRIPHQRHRPIFAKSSIREKDKSYLSEGQIWIKPGEGLTGSTQKRLLKTRKELLDMVDIEPRVQKAVSDRLAHVIPAIRQEERTRIQGTGFTPSSSLSCTDEEFESYLEQLVCSEKVSHLNVLIEKLRDKTVSVWELEIGGHRITTPEEIVRIKRDSEFLPAMRRLALAGILLIKYSAPMDWFNRVVELLLEVFHLSNQISRVPMYISPQGNYVPSLHEHCSYTVPALESLLTAYLLAGYELCKRRSTRYSTSFFPHVIKNLIGPHEEGDRRFYLFWPIADVGGYPNQHRHLLVLERYGTGDRIESIFGGKEAIQQSICQLDFLVDLHSYMSFKEWGEPETVAYFKRRYPGVSGVFYPHYVYEVFDYIMPLVESLWDAIQSDEETGYRLFDAGLADVVRRIEPEKRRGLMARFLLYAEKAQMDYMLSQHRFPCPIYWPDNIRSVIKGK